MPLAKAGGITELNNGAYIMENTKLPFGCEDVYQLWGCVYTLVIGGYFDSYYGDYIGRPEAQQDAQRARLDYWWANSSLQQAAALRW